MGAQPAKVQSTLGVLRGTPVEVYSKSEGRWINAVIGAPKDVREPPPESTAVLVLFKEVVGGRTDAFKWIKAEEISEYVRARPESKRAAGMMDSVIDTNFGTMFENRSAFEKRGNEPAQQMASMGPMGSIPVERPADASPGVMSTIMASVGMAQPQETSAMSSIATTIDQNGSLLQQRAAESAYVHSAAEERPGFMSTLMGSAVVQRPYDPNVHAPQSTADMLPRGQSHYEQPQGVMASIMGMGGSLPASIMGSTNGSMMSMTSMVDNRCSSMVLEENRSPNRTPMGSMNGKAQSPAMNPMSSFMNSIGMTVCTNAKQDSPLSTLQPQLTEQPRRRRCF